MNELEKEYLMSVIFESKAKDVWFREFCEKMREFMKQETTITDIENMLDRCPFDNDNIGFFRHFLLIGLFHELKGLNLKEKNIEIWFKKMLKCY